MIFVQNNTRPARFPIENYASSGTRTPTSLNAAYVHLASGPAIAIRIVAPANEPLNEALLFLDITTGTRANIALRCRVYNAGAAATGPGSTLHATASTITYPGSDDRWIRIQWATPYTPTVNEVIWVIIDNNSVAPATDFPGILTATTTSFGPDNRFVGFSTANGFTTAGTTQSEMPFMFQLGTTWYGQSITQLQNTFFLSSTLKRGIVFSPRTNMRLIGVNLSSSTLTTFDVYESTQLPSETPIFSHTFSSQSRLVGTSFFTGGPILTRGKTYYLVVDVSTNQTLPGGAITEDYASFPTAFSSILNSLTTCGGVQETGTNSWDLYPQFQPNLNIIVEDFVPPAIAYAA